MQTLTREVAKPPTKPFRSSAVFQVAVVTLAMWVISSVGLLIYTAGTRDPVTRDLVIHPGTAERILQGEDPLELPSTWDYYEGDTLTIDNRDAVAHQVGPWFIATGTSLEVVLTPVYSGSFACSLRPDGEVSIAIEPRGYDWRQMRIPVFLFGPILGLLLVGTRRIMSSLDD